RSAVNAFGGGGGIESRSTKLTQSTKSPFPGPNGSAWTALQSMLLWRTSTGRTGSEDLLMKSPFPGMDPYIEACGLWEDFHDDLINEMKRALAQAVPDRYLVRTGERSYVVLVESESKRNHPFLPDISITTQQGRKKPAKKGGTALAE